jgi:hypothetical protein
MSVSVLLALSNKTHASFLGCFLPVGGAHSSPFISLNNVAAINLVCLNPVNWCLTANNFAAFDDAKFEGAWGAVSRSLREISGDVRALPLDCLLGVNYPRCSKTG